jgi:hypothetical protein
MRILRLLVAVSAVSFCLPTFSHDLTGIWIIQPPSPPGMILLQTVTFTHGKKGLTGLLQEIGSRPDPQKTPINEIRMSGDFLSFSMAPGDAADINYFWKGRFVSEQALQMDGFLLINGERIPDKTRVFQRSSSAEIAKLKGALPKNLVYKKASLPPLHALPPNGLALTPPMGWSSWNYFNETIDGNVVRQSADALVSSGLREAGYTLCKSMTAGKANAMKRVSCTLTLNFAT